MKISKTIVIEGEAAKQLAEVIGKPVCFQMDEEERDGKMVVVIGVEE